MFDTFSNRVPSSRKQAETPTGWAIVVLAALLPFTVAYVVRAVTPGRYVLPQAYVEDMYNPSRYGRTASGVVEVRPAK